MNENSPYSFQERSHIELRADTFARTIFSPIEIPVGTVTAFLGGPFFIWLLIKQKTNY